ETLSPHPVSIRLWNYFDEVLDTKNSTTDENFHLCDYNKMDNKKNISNNYCILSLNSNRILYRINPDNNKTNIICKDVHDFYLVRETKDKNENIYLWTYSKNCVQRWSVNNNNVIPLFVSKIQPHVCIIFHL